MSTSFRRPFRYLRYSPAGYVRGDYVEGEASEFGFEGTIQPASSGDYDRLQLMMEGTRVERAIRIYTSAELYTDRTVSGEPVSADEVLYPPLPFRPGYDGPQYRFKIVGKSPWQSGIIPHNRYLAVAVGEQPLT